MSTGDGAPIPEVTVFADVSCPFAYVSLVRVLGRRAERGPTAPIVRVRAWPLEIVNGEPLTGPALVPKIDALRRQVAPDLFTGFDPTNFPSTTLTALAAEHVAYEADPTVGMAFSLAVRRRLFEEGADIGEASVVEQLLGEAGLRRPGDADRAAVERDHRDGVALGVLGSPYYCTENGDFFCPTLDIRHDGGAYDIGFDVAGFERLVTAAFG